MAGLVASKSPLLCIVCQLQKEGLFLSDVVSKNTQNEVDPRECQTNRAFHVPVHATASHQELPSDRPKKTDVAESAT